MTQKQAKAVRIGDVIRDRRNGQILAVRNVAYALAKNVPVSAFETESGDVPARFAELASVPPPQDQEQR